MRISWREFIKQYFSKPSKFHSIGIEMGDAELHLNVIQKKSGSYQWVKQHSLPMQDWVKHLQEYVTQNNLARTPCHVALGLNKYQLFQIDRPEVEEQEVAQAIQWQVKEQLTSTDEHVFDYYDHPAAIGGKEKVNVVAISRPQVTSIIKGISQADLKLSTITIEELATSELLAASDDAVLSLFQEKGGQINLNILKQGKLFFSRRLKGYENLASFSLEEFQMGMGDTLSVEIQRSMDYFESQLRQAPVRHIVVHLNTPIQAQLAELIKELTFMPVSIMDLPLTPNESSPTVSLASLGAALTDIEINSEAGQ
ncbi:MSHA biogenesis protein MshI [Paraglaciecola chathamensis]|uniref:type IV pilus biogenesis protein PilM n=1 Tax=Paraglaciecola chathamensis TaxID=368405 RepID=UPI00270CEBBD|nr:MSHA biogenesis protein MshI [Paraglaciecola chathamensis]MDO6839518.1 MSHA biogenesis protein MshI [Paraglaciecola chathamensis]